MRGGEHRTPDGELLTLEQVRAKVASAVSSAAPDRSEPTMDDRRRLVQLYAVDEFLEDGDLDAAWVYLRPMVFEPLLADPEAWDRLGRLALEVGTEGPVVDRLLAAIVAEALLRVGRTPDQLRLAGRLEALAGPGASARIARQRARHMDTLHGCGRRRRGRPDRSRALFDAESPDVDEPGVLQHPAGVAYWLEKAAEQGNAEARLRLAARLMGGWGIEADKRRAVELAELAMEQGDENAVVFVAHAYEKKLGVDEQRDRRRRQALEERGAAGDHRALTHLALMHFHGRGGEEGRQEAIQLYRRAADAGDPWGMVSLGRIHATGELLPEDDQEAVRLYRRAADAGSVRAIVQLANALFHGHGIERDLEKYVSLIDQAIALGSAHAMGIRGNDHDETGLDELGADVAAFSFSRDEAEAFRWYWRSAQTYPDALEIVGTYYREGRGVPRDEQAAFRWTLRAAESGFAQAQRDVGIAFSTGAGVEPDDVEALRWWRMAAAQGDALAQRNVGWSYRMGRGVGRSDADAAVWFRRAADQGNALAQADLAVMLVAGEGVEKDEQEAVRLFRLAAEQGLMSAQRELGASFALGQGVEVDRVEAMRWWRMAADQGDALAQHNVGLCYKSGEGGVAKSIADAIVWFRKSADQGYAPAKVQLGTILLAGEGVARDNREAARLFLQAAEQGETRAMVMLGWMYRRGLEGAPARPEAVRWLRTAAEAGEAGEEVARRILAELGESS